MSPVGNNLDIRFRKISSRTPLYHVFDRKYYWNHCWYCGVELVYNKHVKQLAANSFTRDHVVPQSLGGYKGNNTVPACNSCNQQKKDLTLEQFRGKRFGRYDLFFGEKKEAELKQQFESKKISLTLGAQIAALYTSVPVDEYKPKPLKCYVGRELILYTPLARILRRLFK